MARKVKNKYIGARVDEDDFARINGYVDAINTVLGDMVREAVEEYMLNHPIKQAQPNQTELFKPGKDK